MAFAIAFLVAAAAILAALGRRAWARAAAAERDRAAMERDRDALTAVIAALPVAGVRWRPDTEESGAAETALGLPGLTFAGVLARLDPGDAVRVEEAVAALRRGGTAFAAAVATTDGAAFELDGRITAAGDSILWLRDLSAVRQAETARAAAADEAARRQVTLDTLPLPVWRRDPALRIVDCNNAYAKALDLTRAAVLAAANEIAPESLHGRMRELARAAIEQGTLKSERCHVVIGGTRRLLRISELPDGGGGTIGLAVDETALDTAERELTRHLDAHRRALENVQAAVAIYGPDRRLGFFNSAFARLWGLDEAWLARRPTFDDVVDRLREYRRMPEVADFRAYKGQRSAMFTSLVEPQNWLMHLPDDRTLSLSVSPYPLGGLMFVYEDVTDRLALERSYNTLIAVQRETLDNLFEGIAVFGGDGRLKIHNAAFRNIWALSAAVLAGEPHVTALVDETREFYDDRGDWPRLRERIAARITAHEAWSGPLDRCDGSSLRLALVPLPDGDVLLTCLDVSDTARVERALRERNEALEAVSRLKSEFVASVSYELRTPLNTVIGFAELLANQYFGELAPRQLEYSRFILESAQRLSTLIEDIIDLSTIEAGYLRLEPARVEVCALLNAVAALSREPARARSLSLSISCPPDILAIEADERRLKQALFNLVSNAIRFTPPGGALRLEARDAAPGEEGRRDLILAVSDTGIGMPPADEERAPAALDGRDPLSRATGAGLGLPLVRSLIELHGGTVTVESAPGSGTTVLCRLPGHLRLM
jgi:signal transduction histidine kinase